MATLYVRPNGNNITTAGSEQTPYKTIQYAFGRSVPGDTIIAMGITSPGWSEPVGIYREVVDGKAGTAIAPITLKAFPGHKIIISALQQVTGWTQHSGNIYSAPVDWTLNVASRPLGNNLLFYSQPGELPAPLRESGHPAIPPGKKFANLTRDDLGFVQSAVPGIGQNKGDLVTSKIVDPNLAGLPALVGAGCTFYGGSMWTPLSGKIIDHINDAIFIQHKYESSDFYGLKPENRYFIFGISQISRPGEWFKDDAANILYLWMPDSSNPNDWIIEFKKQTKVLDIWDRPYLTFEGITFLGGRVNSNSAGLTFKDCHFLNGTHHLYTDFNYQYSGPTLDLVGGNGKAINCIFEGASAGAIALKNNGLVSGCTVKDFSYVGASGAGIVMTGSFNVVEYCEFDGCGGARMVSIESSDTKVRYCLFRNSSRLVLDEGPCFVGRGTVGGATKIWVIYNTIYADKHLFDLAKKFYGCAFVYVEDATGIVVARNICVGSARFALRPSSGNKLCAVEIFNNSIESGDIFWENSSTFSYQVVIKNNLVRRLSEGTNLRSDIIFENNATSEVYYLNNLHVNNPGLTEDWELLPTSPLRDAGVIVPGITDGYRGSAPDIGAKEFVPLEIASIFPTSGLAGEVVIIEGSRFSAQSIVYFGDRIAEIEAIDGSTIRAIVPEF